MFNNSGKKVKSLALITFFLSFLASLIGAIILFSVQLEWIAALVLVCGWLVAWIAVLPLFALGEAADQAAQAAEAVRNLDKRLSVLSNKIDRLQKASEQPDPCQ